MVISGYIISQKIHKVSVQTQRNFYKNIKERESKRILRTSEPNHFHVLKSLYYSFSMSIRTEEQPETQKTLREGKTIFYLALHSVYITER